MAKYLISCGAVAMLLAHCLAFCFQILFFWMAPLLFGGHTDSFGRPLPGPVHGLLQGAPMLAAGSLLLVDWVTVPLGAALGVVVRSITRKLEEREVA